MTPDQEKTLDLMRRSGERVRVTHMSHLGMPIVQVNGVYFALTPLRAEKSKTPGIMRVVKNIWR